MLILVILIWVGFKLSRYLRVVFGTEVPYYYYLLLFLIFFLLVTKVWGISVILKILTLDVDLATSRMLGWEDFFFFLFPMVTNFVCYYLSILFFFFS